MRTFLHRSKNEYLQTQDGIWVRNLCKPAVSPLNINDINSDADKRLFLENETKNLLRGSVYLPPTRMKKVIILSDGFDFESKQEALKHIPTEDVFILATNGVLNKWNLADASLPTSQRRRINYYVINNPYPQSLKYLPKVGRYVPPCIAASRTYSTFIERYKDTCYFYASAEEENFGGRAAKTEFFFDDYRNPVCAALSLARHFGAEKIILFCCDDSSKSERPSMTHLENGLWSYPQQIMGQHIIGTMCHWLALKGGIKIADCSSGIKYDDADYIRAEDITEFLNEEQR